MAFPRSSVDRLTILMTSDWMTRLRTLQEAEFSTRLTIKNSGHLGSVAGIINSVLRGNERHENNRSAQLTRFWSGMLIPLLGLFGKSISASVLADQNVVLGQPIDFGFFYTILWSPVYRTTSHPKDEAVCLAVLFKKDSALSSILSPSTDSQARYNRYQVFIKTLKEVPRDFLFSMNGRLQAKGLRWAPDSFMGATSIVSMMGEDTSLLGINQKMGIVSEEGLQTTGSGFFLTLPSDNFLSRAVDDNSTVICLYPSDIECSKCSKRLFYAVVFEEDLVYSIKQTELNSSLSKGNCAILFRGDFGTCPHKRDKPLDTLHAGPRGIVVHVRDSENGLLMTEHVHATFIFRVWASGKYLELAAADESGLLVDTSDRFKVRYRRSRTDAVPIP